MTVAVTGAQGFLAWHLRCRHWALTGEDVIHIGRAEFADEALMDAALQAATSVIHLAGVNRAPAEDEISAGNRHVTERLVAGLERTDQRIPVVFGNSIQADTDSVFGVAKRDAADTLHTWAQAVGVPFTDVYLPNIFGEHGRPFYNSVVATFSHQLANAESPEIVQDREIPLLHAQDAVQILLDAVENERSSVARPEGTERTVSQVLEQLSVIHERYLLGQLPDLADPFTRALFNTYRSFTFPQMWPIHPPAHRDDRGELFEAVRGLGGETQVFFSHTKPGFTRGDHFHLRKVERFLVVQGSALIRLRRMFTEHVIEFQVDGESPAILDMPTLWTHSITNTGDSDLLTLFYADDEFNPADPDTYWISV